MELNPSAEKKIKELELELRDAQITNKAKDMVIEKYETERGQMIERLTTISRQVCVLETRLLQLEAPKGEPYNNDETVTIATVIEPERNEWQGQA